jgi:Ca2+-binding RTX toxin-like protein
MMRIMTLILAMTALPANAGTFTPPEGCTLTMTVQSRQCRVSNHYTCTQDAPGERWRADFDQEGIFFSSKIDNETQWVESLDSDPPVVQRLAPNPKDPASFSGLLSTGRDDFVFDLTRDDGNDSSVTGYDRLTGETFVIDGIQLQGTEFEFAETDPAGNIVRQARGNEYIHPEWRLFFAGPGETLLDGEMLPIDGSPLQFIFPGEPGFAATQPLFECDDVLSWAVPGAVVVPVKAVR